MLVIMTGTIRPKKNIVKLAETDADTRRNQYIEAVLSVLKTPGVDKLVFCDNSGEILRDDRLTRAAEEYETQLEILEYEADADKVSSCGKGYGEGDAMKYVLEHSELVKDEQSFMKLTGRLKVRNLERVLKKLRPGENYFQGMYLHNPEHLADTRCYVVNTQVYRQELMTVHEQVRDREHYYLEHAFSDAIRTKKIPYRNMPVYPEICGISGSSGKTYRLPIFKKVMKRVAGALNLMKV